MKYIKNAKIILKDRIVEGKALAYSDKIEAITCECAIPEGAEVIDAKGAYVAPGFIDIHIHGYLGEDASDGSAEGIRKMAEGIAKNGVTSWLPTTMTVSKAELEKAFEVISSLMEESKTWNGATILGVNAEGPCINSKKKGAQAEEHILKPEASFFKKYASLIKIATLAPETDENMSCIRELARDTDILLSMGHTDATYEQAIKAIQNGVKHVTHLFNAQTALQHRNPGVVGAALSTDVTAELICDTFHIHKGLFSLVAAAKGDKLVLITLGKDGSEWRYKGNRSKMPTITVKPIDTTGAGDAFFAGALSILDQNVGKPLTEQVLSDAIRFGNVAGALNTTGRGAIDNLPDLDTVNKYINK